MTLRAFRALSRHYRASETLCSVNMSTKKTHLELTSDQFREPGISEAKISEIRELSPTVKGFRLKVNEKSEINKFKAGQWLDLFIPGVSQVGGFSMVSSPQQLEKDKFVDLAIKASKWPPANWMNTKAKIDDKVSFRFGGNFHYPNEKINSSEPHRLILIGGGVGINPLASIVFHLADHGFPVLTELYLSARKPEELLFKSCFENLSSKFDNFKTNFYITGASDKRIDSETIVKDAKRTSYYFICGPNQMIKDLSLSLETEQEVSPDRIFYELWW